MRKRDTVTVAGLVALVVTASCGAGDTGSPTNQAQDGSPGASSREGGGGGAHGTSTGSRTSTGSPTGDDGSASADDASPPSGAADADDGGSPHEDADAPDAASADATAPSRDGAAPTHDASASSPEAGARPPADAGTASPDAGAAACKRGIASNAAPSSALAPTASSPGVSWWYNWAIGGSGGAPGIEFVPMVWGTSTAKSALPAGARYVLGFNEPNFKSQSDLSPQQAAAAWPDIQAHAKAAGIPLVSPAVNFCGSASDSSGCTTSTITDPYTWLKDFFAACAGCEVDAVAVHWYNCDLPSLKAYIDGNTGTGGGLQGFVQFDKPIWLTEFSCGGGSSVADQTSYMKAAVPYLEGNAHVARYSWFSAGPIPNAELMNGDGTLTDLGKTYASLPESCRN